MRKSKEFFARALAVALAAAMPVTMGSTSALAASTQVVSTYDATQADLSTGYTFVYAGLTWGEYWAGEDVYANGDTTSSDKKDSREELDKGAFDTVTRATKNHGLHRGSYQCMATIYDTAGNKYELAGWDGKTTIILTNNKKITFDGGKITKADGSIATMDHYEVTGIKYVPVAVKTADYDEFCKKYPVASNGTEVFGGFGEGVLSSYSEKAAVTASTNGLKVATKNSDGSFSFSARQTGNNSGLQDKTQKKATDITSTVKEANGSYGEFLRVDINGTGYGDLGANMQAVRWDYYGNDDTYSKKLASFGTKFAADNWMHKSQGIQLGLTDSLRCQLPTGTDGTGYWKLTVYALGYEDTVIEFKATDENIVKPETAEVNTTTLEATVKKAEALNEVEYTAESWSSMQLELQEAKDELAKENKTQAAIDEANSHLSAAIEALVRKDVYVLMNIPYDQFYKADVKNDVKVDAFTSATKNKSRTKTMVNGSYHVDPQGTDITGVTYAVKLGKGVTLETLAQKYKQVTDSDKVEISVTNRGQSSTTTYEGKDALFENGSYSYYVLSEVPTSYKEVTIDSEGNLSFGAIQNANIQKMTGVTAELLTQSSYGDYQLSLDGLDKYVGRNDAIYGVVVSTKEGDSYGLRHMENIWFGSELSWATGFTTAVHNCPTSSEHYKKMMGQTINKVTYYTEKGNFELDLGAGIYVPVKFDTSSIKVEDAKFDEGSTNIDVSALPSDYKAVYSVDGLSDVKVENGKLTFATKDANPGAHTLTISDANKKYADVTVKFVLSTDANVVAFNNNAKAPALVAVDGANLSEYIANITSVNVDGKDYAASGRGATVIVKEDGTLDLAKEGVDLTSVGTHTVTVKATGYKDVTFSYQVKTDLSALKATVKDVTYNGNAQIPAVTVEGLTLNKDYKVTYKNNVNAGTATATITGIGSYEGTKTVTFTIKKAASSVSLKAKTATYTGKNIAVAKANVKGSKGKVTYTYYSDAKCTKKATPKNAGTYYVKASVAADSNYNGATSKAVKLIIKKATATIKAKTTSKTVKVSAVKKKAQSFTIGATATSKAKVTYKKSSGSKNITVSSTGKVTVKKGTKKGTYNVKVKTSAKATSNYNAVTKTVTVKVVVK